VHVAVHVAVRVAVHVAVRVFSLSRSRMRNTSRLKAGKRGLFNGFNGLITVSDSSLPHMRIEPILS